MEQLEVSSEHEDTWDVFSEGHKQLPSLVKAGMSHMAPLHALIRRVLQLRVGLVAIKEVSSLPSKPPFSRTSPVGAQRNYTSPPLDQIGADKPFFVEEGRGILDQGIGAFLYRSGLVGFQQDKHWFPLFPNNEQQGLITFQTECESVCSVLVLTWEKMIFSNRWEPE